jgi:hypothetical protein
VYVLRLERKRKACRFFVGNCKNRAWENDIKIAIKDIGRECMDWMRLAQSRGFQSQAVMKKDVKLTAL